MTPPVSNVNCQSPFVLNCCSNVAIATPPPSAPGIYVQKPQMKSNFFTNTFGQVFSAESAVPLIIDTDASFDVDDVVAICMAHALMDNGEVMSIMFFMMMMLMMLISNKMMIIDLIEHCQDND